MSGRWERWGVWAAWVALVMSLGAALVSAGSSTGRLETRVEVLEAGEMDTQAKLDQLLQDVAWIRGYLRKESHNEQ